LATGGKDASAAQKVQDILGKYMLTRDHWANMSVRVACGVTAARRMLDTWVRGWRLAAAAVAR
jgi:hypothetical protein